MRIVGLSFTVIGALVLLYGWYVLKVTLAVGLSGNADQRPTIYNIIGFGVLLIVAGIVWMLVDWWHTRRK